MPRGAAQCYACDNITVYDVWSLSQMVRQTTGDDSLFFVDADDVHYQPWVYDKLNLALIRLLGYGDIIYDPSQNTSQWMFEDCVSPTCNDCRALWWDDAAYSWFHCGSCHAKYMKPSKP